MVMAHIIRKIHVIFSKCDNVIENIQIHISSLFDLKFCTNVKTNMKRESKHFCFLKRKSLYFQKIENHVYWFWFSNFLKMFK